jgi:tetratricopeptide (TPR) repeat protein
MILAEAYANQKNFKDAADALKKALEMQPDNDRLARSLAEDLFFSDQYDEALKIYGELAAHNPKEIAYPLRMADIYGAKHDYAKAHEAIDKAKKIDPGDEDPRLAEVRMFELESKHDEAIAALKSLLDDTAQEGLLQGRAEDSAPTGSKSSGSSTSRRSTIRKPIEAVKQMSVFKDSGR